LRFYGLMVAVLAAATLAASIFPRAARRPLIPCRHCGWT